MECKNGGGYDHRKSYPVPLGATVDMCQILPEVNRVLRGGMGKRGGPVCIYITPYTFFIKFEAMRPFRDIPVVQPSVKEES